MGPKEIQDITFRGPEVDDREMLVSLPGALQEILTEINGFIVSHGTLHVRGACRTPEWHSLRAVTEGELALHSLYESVHHDDIPFAEDCVGDQFLLRGDRILRLCAETDEIEGAAIDLHDFFSQVANDPEQILGPAADHRLSPGELLHAHPPFCVQEAEADCSMQACSAREVILFHADLARQIRDIPEGGTIDIVVRE